MVNKEKQKIETYISFSEYRLRLSCPFKHFLSKVLQIQDQPNEYLVFGSAIHGAVEEIALKKPLKFLWGKIFEKHLEKNKKSYPLTAWQKQTFIRQGTDILQDLDFHKRYEGYEIFSVEEEIFDTLYEDDTYKISFKGFVDLVLKKGDEILILDWKSANQPWDLKKKYGVIEKEKNVYVFPEDVSDNSEEKGFFGQVALYKNFIGKKYNFPLENIKVAYVVLPREGGYPQQYDVEVGEKFLKFILQDLKDKAIEIVNINPLQLEKAKLNNRKKDCFFCMFKNTDYCNDEQYQIPYKHEK